MLVGWLILLPPGVGYYIMRYESDPLPSYPELRNFSYSVKLITTHPRLLPRFIYRFLIPPLYQTARPRHPLCLYVQFIDGESRHPLWYGRLSPLDLHPNGVDPRGFHFLH